MDGFLKQELFVEVEGRIAQNAEPMVDGKRGNVSVILACGGFRARH